MQKTSPARHQMTSETSPGLIQTGGDLFKDNKGIQEDTKYPTLAEYLQDWEKISRIAWEAHVKIDDTKLDSIIDMGFMKMS